MRKLCLEVSECGWEMVKYDFGTIEQCRKTGCLYWKTPQIQSENEGFISPTAIFAQCNRHISQPNRRNRHSTRRTAS